MAEKRRGLGRGLGALITSAPTEGDDVEPQEPKPAAAPKPARKKPASSGGATQPRTSVSAGVVSARSAERPGTDSTPKSKKSRPADMFFTPTADGRPRKPVPDVLGKRQSSTSEPSPDLVQVPGASFLEVKLSDIHPNRKQPRSVFDEEELDELVRSIREVGLLQPIVVRPSREADGIAYELVMGERRWRASQAAGLKVIPAIVRDTDDSDLLRDALLENLHRSQLNPLEEAAAYQQLLTEFDCTQDELSQRIGRSRPQISNTIRLMRLPALVQRRVAAGVLSAGHARALLALDEAEEMERLAQKIVNEGLSVRATEELVALAQGAAPKTARRRQAEPQRHERLDFLASSLQDRLDTNVKITLGARKGKVQIDFATVDDLNRIMALMSPPNSTE